MSQVLELVSPEVRGSVDQSLLQALSDTLPERAYTALPPTRPSDLATCFNEWGNAKTHIAQLTEMAINLGSRVTTVKSVGFTLLKETLEPRENGSNPGTWHTDTFEGEDHALLIALGLTTEFPVGQVPIDDEVRISDLGFMAAMLIPQEPETERDKVTLYRPKEGEFAVLTNSTIHRAPKNRATEPIDRLFIKFDIETRHKFFAHIPQLIRRAHATSSIRPA
jgi:hypothetical protein